jgi:hypothetical protein
MAVFSGLQAQVQFYGPKFLILFGASCVAIEFFIRDQEMSHIRDFFIRVWYKINRVKNTFDGTLQSSIFAKPALVVIGSFSLIAQNVADLEMLTPSQIDLLFSSSAIPLFLVYLLSTGVMIVLWNDIDCYTKYALSGSSPYRAAFLLLQIPLALGLFRLMLTANPRVSQSVFTLGFDFFFFGLFGIPLFYIAGLSQAYLFATALYFPAAALVFLAERVTLRIAELPRGPVFAISTTVAVPGLIIEFL